MNLNADGTFEIQISFPEGMIDCPIVSTSEDGEQTRSIQMSFIRQPDIRDQPNTIATDNSNFPEIQDQNENILPTSNTEQNLPISKIEQALPESNDINLPISNTEKTLPVSNDDNLRNNETNQEETLPETTDIENDDRDNYDDWFPPIIRP